MRPDRNGPAGTSVGWAAVGPCTKYGIYAFWTRILTPEPEIGPPISGVEAGRNRLKGGREGRGAIQTPRKQGRVKPGCQTLWTSKGTPNPKPTSQILAAEPESRTDPPQAGGGPRHPETREPGPRKNIFFMAKAPCRVECQGYAWRPCAGWETRHLLIIMTYYTLDQHTGALTVRRS